MLHGLFLGSFSRYDYLCVCCDGIDNNINIVYYAAVNIYIHTFCFSTV